MGSGTISTYRTDAISGNGEGLQSWKKADGCEEGQTDGSPSPACPQFCSPELSCPVPCPAAPGASSTEVAPCCARSDWDALQSQDRHSEMGTGSRSRLLGLSTPRSPQIWSQVLPGGRAASGPSAAPQSWAATDPIPQLPRAPFHFSPASSSYRVSPGWTRCHLRPPAQHRTQPAHRHGPFPNPPAVVRISAPPRSALTTLAPRAAEQNKTSPGCHGRAFLPPLSLLCLPSWVLHGGGRPRHPWDART